MSADDESASAVEVESTEGRELVDADSESTEETAEPAVAPKRRRAVGRYLVPIVLVAAILLSGSAAVWAYLTQYRPDQQTNAAAADVVMEAAKMGTVALLSYSPETLDQDFSTAKSHLTGDFLSYYTDFTEKVVAPAAAQKSVKTEANVVQAAVSDLKPDSAEVLLFINQNTVSTENPDGAFAASSVKVGLTKIDGAWLIVSFDPV